MINQHWANIQSQLQSLKSFMPIYARNPVDGMRRLPQLDWSMLLGFHVVVAAICGIIGNLIERNWLGAIASTIVAPLAAFVLTFFLTGFFYYLILIVFKTTPSFYSILQNLIFAALPSQFLGVLSGLVPPVYLIGMAASLMLLYVGFVSNLRLEAKKLRNVLFGLFAIFAAYWIFQLVQNTSSSNRIRIKATPESLDILEKEMQ